MASHLLDPDWLVEGVPHEHYAKLRESEPVFWQEREEGGYWALLRHADVVQVSSDPSAFSAASKGMFIDDLDLLPTLLNLDPPAHGEVRRPLVHHFAPRAADALEPQMRVLVREVFRRAAAKGGGECDFVSDLATPLPLHVISEMLGIPEEDRERLGQAADKMAAFDDPELGHDLRGKEQSEAAMELGMYAFGLGSERPEGVDDLVAALVRSTVNGETVDVPTFSGLFVQVLIGGNETTRTLLCGGMLELIRRPELYAELAANPERVPGAIEEMLRWVSPVHYFRRTATRDTEIGGRKIREGDRVAMIYAAANRDPAVFSDPERFDIQRRPNPHVAFGFGEHFCIGARIARLEARVFLEEFFRCFERVEFAGPVERVRSNQLNSTKRMPVRLHGR